MRLVIQPVACIAGHTALIGHVFKSLFTFPQPNCKFNVDANSGHAFGILLAAVGTLRPSGSGAS